MSQITTVVKFACVISISTVESCQPRKEPQFVKCRNILSSKHPIQACHRCRLALGYLAFHYIAAPIRHAECLDIRVGEYYDISRRVSFPHPNRISRCIAAHGLFKSFQPREGIRLADLVHRGVVGNVKFELIAYHAGEFHALPVGIGILLERIVVYRHPLPFRGEVVWVPLRAEGERPVRPHVALEEKVSLLYRVEVFLRVVFQVLLRLRHHSEAFHVLHVPTRQHKHVAGRWA